MDFTTLGRTGLRVSVAGLGCGGFSRLGKNTGKTEAESVALVRLALDSGINLIDTAANYGTEAIVGQAIAGLPREEVVIATKCGVKRSDGINDPADVLRSLENSLRTLGTDHVDIFQLHGVAAADYRATMDQVVPVLLRAKAAGKFRYLGITENASQDPDHRVLLDAVDSGVFDTVMVAFNMLHRTASDALFARTRSTGVGTLIMHAVRSIFARPDALAAGLRAEAAAGRLAAAVAEEPDPLGFLVHEGGAENVTDAAYRFARHEPGADVVLFGTGSPAHLRANVASLLRPALPEADRARLLAQFAAVSGLGLEGPAAAKAA